MHKQGKEGQPPIMPLQKPEQITTANSLAEDDVHLMSKLMSTLAEAADKAQKLWLNW